MDTASVCPINPGARYYISAIAYVAVVVVFLSIWHWKTTGNVSGPAVAAFMALSSAALIYGRFVLRLSPLPEKLADALTLQFLFGFLLLNTALFILSLAFPWSVGSCFLTLFAVGLATLFVRVKRRKIESETTARVPDLLCLLISGIGATLWCSDALSPVIIGEQETVFRFWHDSFAHMRMISTFAQSHGLGTVSDLRMAGAPPFFYHYGSYFSPAAFVSLTGASALEAFTGFQLPFGVLLSGIAAFGLAASLWGPWPGLAASFAVIILPDAYQQGFANRYLSYNFLQQVGLGCLYGVSCAAAAWILILHGCKSGKYTSIVFGYALILLTLAYKSHIFVANSFLAIIYPCLFFTGLRASWRWIVGTALLAFFGVAVWLSQMVEGVPALRPDLTFRSAAQYAKIVLISYESGLFKSFFNWLILPDRPRVIVGLSAAGMLLLSSFGVWIGAFGVMFLLLRKRIKEAAPFFPLFLILNYLVMALGLSLNTGSFGSFDELQNRPLVWAYFGVVSWTSGAAYALAFGNHLPRGGGARVCIVGLVLSSFIIPWHFARDLQNFPTWRGFADLYASFPSASSCLVRAALYIRQHSQSGDVIQDSENDPHMLVGALAERQEFADDWVFGKRSKGLEHRLSDLGWFKATANEADLVAYATKNKIRWYLLRPESKVDWPERFQAKSLFDCDGYRVYHF
jgi:hypothetical protein